MPDSEPLQINLFNIRIMRIGGALFQYWYKFQTLATYAKNVELRGTKQFFEPIFQEKNWR